MIPLNRTIVITPLVEEKKGLDLDGISDNRFQKGKVYAAFEGSLVNEGEVVLYDTAQESPAEYKDEEYKVVSEQDIKWVERD